VFINIVSGEGGGGGGGPTLRSIYENISKKNLFAMFVRVNLSMIVDHHLRHKMSKFQPQKGVVVIVKSSLQESRNSASSSGDQNLRWQRRGYSRLSRLEREQSRKAGSIVISISVSMCRHGFISHERKLWIDRDTMST
jgi:hypothetical protein